MFKFKFAAVIALIGTLFFTASHSASAQSSFAGIGRTTTANEVKAWDIDVRPDFKGLPKGSGSVAKGQDVWEAKCASCHGYFGESNQFFNPIVGGVSAGDSGKGLVARLRDPGYPQRTTMMKLSTVSTLWDYINRAMPWNNPKTLTTDEVYAVTAFILNLSSVVPDEFVLSHTNIAAVQATLPNRAGMTVNHALWPDPKTIKGQSKPDVTATRCMTDCVKSVVSTSSQLPDYARDSHGNLAEQNRLVGPQRGAVTSTATPVRPAAVTTAASAGKALEPPSSQMSQLLSKSNCTACHAQDSTLLGPSFAQIAQKYAQRSDAALYLAGKIRQGSSGVWGSIPMPATGLGESDAASIARWLSMSDAKPDQTQSSSGQPNTLK